MGPATIAADQLLNGVASRLIYEGSICDSWPCWNEGECIPNGTRSYTCICPSSFTGTYCQLRISHLCANGACQPGTSCIIDGFEIHCPKGKTPTDFLSSCLSTVCLNGGSCEETPSGHRCSCPEPFHGPFCQFDTSTWVYDWTSIEVFLFLLVLFLIACAIGMICCSGNMGFYVSVPTKKYDRWEDGELSDDEVEIALGDMRKSQLHLSQTTETMMELDPTPTCSWEGAASV